MKKFALFLILLLLSTAPSFAGGGYIITSSGAPSEWSTSSAISVHPESGTCGSFTNAEMLTKISDNLSYWTDLGEVDFDFNIVVGALGSVDGDNYGDYLVGVTGSDNAQALNDGYNPILFDNDGDIVAAVAGSTNRFRVLGFANPSGFSSNYTSIVDGQAVFNCRCLSGNPNGDCTVGASTITFSEDELNFTMVHEIGHFMNLDHTQVNCTGSDSDNICDDGDTSNDDYIPTMYPVSENAAQQISPIQDDISALAGIYPNACFTSSHCLVTGALLDADGNQLRCADVQAIPSDLSKSVAFVSGAYAPAEDSNGNGDTVDPGECVSNCGDFQLYLDPGVDYTIKVHPINSTFTGGSGISPCANGQLTTINTETIATVTAAQCTEGATITLGDLTTTSTGGVTPSGSESVDFLIASGSAGPLNACTTSTGGTTMTTASSSSSSSGCSLSGALVNGQGFGAMLLIGLSLIGIVRKRFS